MTKPVPLPFDYDAEAFFEMLKLFGPEPKLPNGSQAKALVVGCNSLIANKLKELGYDVTGMDISAYDQLGKKSPKGLGIEKKYFHLAWDFNEYWPTTPTRYDLIVAANTLNTFGLSRWADNIGAKAEENEDGDGLAMHGIATLLRDDTDVPAGVFYVSVPVGVTYEVTEDTRVYSLDKFLNRLMVSPRLYMYDAVPYIVNDYAEYKSGDCPPLDDVWNLPANPAKGHVLAIGKRKMPTVTEVPDAVYDSEFGFKPW